MSSTKFKDILINARQESHRMQHYYIGVEHIFIALLEIRGGIANTILETYGFQSHYIIDVIRRKIGKGGKVRLWSGIPNTPRAEIIIDIAHEIALEDGRDDIQEQDLLIAILDESENIITHILKILGLDINKLKATILSGELNHNNSQKFVGIQLNPNQEISINEEHSYILRRMFHYDDDVLIQEQLSSYLTKTVCLIVQPYQTPAHSQSSCVVRFDKPNIILDEAHRYLRYIHNSITTQITSNPVAPEASDLAGIKYDFKDQSHIQSVLKIIDNWQVDQISNWIQKQIFEAHGIHFWQTRQPYEFIVLQEYDSLLPPLLTLKLVKVSEKSNIQINPSNIDNQIKQIEKGTIVELNNCVVTQIDKNHKIIELSFPLANEPFPNTFNVVIEDVDFRDGTYYRGEVIQHLIGKVILTRDDYFKKAVSQLQFEFNTQLPHIIYKDIKISNPISTYSALLTQHIKGTKCILHGNMHLGNLLIDSKQNCILINFANTREGHTLYDWAVLEVSLLIDYILPSLNSVTWENLWQLTRYIHQLNLSAETASISINLGNRLTILDKLRKTIYPFLSHPNDWSEYLVSLAFVSMQTFMLDELDLTSRRLLYLISGSAMQAFYQYANNENPDNNTD